MIATTPRYGIAAVVFDMDGTLLDTEPLYREAIFAACAELGYEMTEALHAAQVGVPNDMARALFLAEFGTAFPFDRYHRRMHENMGDIEAERGISHKRGARDLLLLLRARGIPAAVVTSTARPMALKRLDRAGLIDLFEVVIGRDDTVLGKPHPEPFLTAAERLGVAPGACLALEDSPNGIRAASGAGMIAVMVPDLIAPTPEVAAMCSAIHPDLDAVRLAYFADAAA
ncbi:MAG: HAD family phosphatase [Alphaproteobacteria bacterium]|nr:HAD family phosphatase [Alphaproteobacteria bacterium]